MPRIYVSTGEPSGDLHAAGLVTELKAMERGLEVFGMGGGALRRAGCEIIQGIDRLSVVGFVEVLTRLPYIAAAMRRALAECRRRRPDLAVLVDYPGFHMRLAERLSGMGVPVVTYVAPQVWAWRPERAARLARVVKKVLVIFEFEVPILREAGAEVEFVGHPLLDEIDLERRPGSVRKRLGVPDGAELVAIAPGSRRHEIRNHLPLFLKAFRKLTSVRPGARGVVAAFPGSISTAKTPSTPRRASGQETLGGLGALAVKAVSGTAGMQESLLRASVPPWWKVPADIPIVHGTHDLLRDATCALCASGTVTLEAALLGCPAVVGYRTGRLSYAIGRRLVRVPHIALANIVLGERVLPELIQDRLTPEAAAVELLSFLTDPERREAVSKRLLRTRALLGGKGASRRAAEAVLKLLA